MINLIFHNVNHRMSSLVMKYSWKEVYTKLLIPFDRFVISDFDDFEKLLHFVFYHELNIEPSEHPVLLSEAVHNPKGSRNKYYQIMFETFNVPACYVAWQPVWTHYASGRHTSLVVESG